MKKLLVPSIVFVIAAALGLTIAWQTYQSGRNRGRVRFQAVAGDVVDRVSERLDLHVSLLRSIAAFLSTENGFGDRGPFSRFVTAFDLDEHYRGAEEYGLASVIRPGDEAPTEARLKSNYGIDRSIFPATDQAWRTPVIIVEPSHTGNQATIGYDMYSDPVRRAAMDKAMVSGKPTATAPLELLQDKGGARQPGILLYLPLYKDSASSGGATSLEQVRGFVFAAYRIADLFDSALTRGPIAPVAFSVWDRKPEPDNLVYTSAATPSPGFGDDYAVRQSVDVGGRNWIFQLSPTADFSPPSSLFEAVTIAIVSLFLAASLALLTRSQTRRVEIADALNREIEHSLAQTDLMLEERKHRIKNLFARVLAIARQTAGNSDSLTAFNDAFSARLQAMANAQDLLTRAAWDKADLRELILSELSQVFGDRLDESALQGPEAKLSEAVTHALGLTVHELATNALKYGNVIGEGGGMEVRWHLEPGASGQVLHLRWREWGPQPVLAPSRPGFGTRLIDANIRDELGGSIERVFGGKEFRLSLTVPLA